MIASDDVKSQPARTAEPLPFSFAPIISFCDNESAVKLSDSDKSTKRMKHVLTRMAYLQELIDAGTLTLVHIDTDGNVADIGTKVLGPTTFHNHRRFLVYE